MSLELAHDRDRTDGWIAANAYFGHLAADAEQVLHV